MKKYHGNIKGYPWKCGNFQKKMKCFLEEY